MVRDARSHVLNGNAPARKELLAILGSTAIPLGAAMLEEEAGTGA